MSNSQTRILLYILRRDVRLADNPAFHFASQHLKRGKNSASSSISEKRNRDDPLISEHGGAPFTHLLPVYVFPAKQVESSGFLASPSDRCPYPEARSEVAKVWRTGPHRVKFTAQGVWDLKGRLERLGCESGLQVRVGSIEDVVRDILEFYAKRSNNVFNKAQVTGIWMTGDDGTEEKDDERLVERLAAQHDVDFKLWEDTKFYVDECVLPTITSLWFTDTKQTLTNHSRDLPYESMEDLPNVYTTYRKALEPLRDRPRITFPTPTELPPLPPDIPPQKAPFVMPSDLDDVIKALLTPLLKDPAYTLTEPPQWPTDVKSAHPFSGGETPARERLAHLVASGAMTSYKATRNGMLGVDFSTKLSAFLAHGHLTARQVHWAMIEFEEGRGPGKGAPGYGKGENEGTAAVRFELLWRDYMRLCMRKFGRRMFSLYGIQQQASTGRNQQPPKPRKEWRLLDKRNRQGDDPKKTQEDFSRFRSGRTGVGLIDASNRELFCTGYTSNRARQNVASFLSSHLEIDWRIGAEWYECFLIDYDVASNWGNWQYVAGVGNDPRQGRVFNPVKQALDYDAKGDYIKAWVPELRSIKLTKGIGPGREEIDQQRLMLLYQPWRLNDWEKNNLGLRGVEWIEQPLARIQFSVGRRGAPDSRPRRGGGGGGHWRGSGMGRGSRDMRRLGEEERAQRQEEGPMIVRSQ